MSSRALSAVGLLHPQWLHALFPKAGDREHRFVPFIDGPIQQYQRTEAKLLCVAHGGLNWMNLPLVLSNIDTESLYQQQGFPYTAMIVAELTAEGLVCIEWNGKKISVHGHVDPR